MQILLWLLCGSPTTGRDQIQLAAQFCSFEWVSDGQRRGDSPAGSPLGRGGGLHVFVLCWEEDDLWALPSSTGGLEMLGPESGAKRSQQ